MQIEDISFSTLTHVAFRILVILVLGPGGFVLVVFVCVFGRISVISRVVFLLYSCIARSVYMIKSLALSGIHWDTTLLVFSLLPVYRSHFGLNVLPSWPILGVLINYGGGAAS